MDSRRQITCPDQIQTYILAGRGTLTIVSPSGARFTYKLRLADEDPNDVTGHVRPIFVKVLTGPDNTNSYTYIGCLWQGVYKHGRKSRISADAQSVRAFSWFMRDIKRAVDHGIEVWHEGKCGKCGRKLTVPESIEQGFGPVCMAAMNPDVKVNPTYISGPHVGVPSVYATAGGAV